MAVLKEKFDDVSKGYLKVPTALIGVFIFMTMQTLGAVWWASGQSTKLDFIKQNQDELKVIVKEKMDDRYTLERSKIDWSANNIRINIIEVKLEQLKEDVISFQSRHKSSIINN